MNVPICTMIAAAGVALSVTSCVDPYYAGGSVTATTYQPGYVVPVLPSGYSTVTIAGTPYYHHHGTYYRPRGRGYVVVDAPHGHRGPYGDRDHDGVRNRYDRHDYHGRDVQVIRRLPGGYTRVTHHGRVYYRSGGTYYESRGDGYVIVPSPF